MDEAFLDVTGTIRALGDAESIGRSIKSDIRRELELTASVGIAALKFVAKIGSDLGKPDGFVVVRDGEITDFLDPLPISRLWGVGPVGQRKLESMHIHKIGDIRLQSLESLRLRLGNWGEHLWQLANGIDPRKVIVDHEAKQISHERTFSHDETDHELLEAVVSHLSEQVAMRLRRHERKTTSITLKYRRQDFRTFVKRQSTKSPTSRTREIMDAAFNVLAQMRERHPGPVRLIGVSAGNLTSPKQATQMSLFDESAAQSDRAVDDVVDQLSDKLGRGAVYRATSHRWIRRNDKE